MSLREITAFGLTYQLLLDKVDVSTICFSIYDQATSTPHDMQDKGGNLAMLNAAEFARAQLTTKDPLEAINYYETAMVVRSKEAAEESARNFDLCISLNGAELITKQMQL